MYYSYYEDPPPDDVISSYTKELIVFGADDPRSVKWATRETQYFRFKILSEIADLSEAVILDYGCGVGDLLDYLTFQGFRGRYVGVDINKNLIDAAKKKHPGAKFMVGQMFPKNEYTLISGMFNDIVARDTKNHLQFIQDTITKSFHASIKGVAFNAISSLAAHKSKDMRYVDPCKLMDWCLARVTPFATLQHDYRGGNFTIYLYKHRGVAF